MIQKIHAAFPHCATNCCNNTTKDDKIIIIDNVSGRASIHDNSSPASYPHFTITNNCNEDVHFLAIDNCIFFSNDGEKCDFAAYNHSTFCFVELKRGWCSKKDKAKRLLKAMSQLSETISKFRSAINFDGYKLEAYPCVGYKNPVPKARASNRSKSIEFWDNHQVLLCEGNHVTFS